jgi:predicted lipoprotein with Yx(FWY)xxD motif
MQNQRWAVAAGLIAAGLTISACSSVSTNDGATGAMATQSANVSTTITPSPMQAMSTTPSKGGLMKVESSMAGRVLANPHGLTVYYYSADKRDSGVSACTGACAVAWPPVVSPIRMPAGVRLGTVGYIVRAGGVRQVTINGYPIYRYAGDHAAGEANGNGIGGVWHVFVIASPMKPSAPMQSTAPMHSTAPMQSTAPMTPAATTSSASSGGGGW